MMPPRTPRVSVQSRHSQVAPRVRPSHAPAQLGRPSLAAGGQQTAYAHAPFSRRRAFITALLAVALVVLTSAFYLLSTRDAVPATAAQRAPPRAAPAQHEDSAVEAAAAAAKRAAPALSARGERADAQLGSTDDASDPVDSASGVLAPVSTPTLAPAASPADPPAAAAAPTLPPELSPASLYTCAPDAPGFAWAWRGGALIALAGEGEGAADACLSAGDAPAGDDGSAPRLLGLGPCAGARALTVTHDAVMGQLVAQSPSLPQRGPPLCVHASPGNTQGEALQLRSCDAAYGQVRKAPCGSLL
jgi:hypothetical protein